MPDLVSASHFLAAFHCIQHCLQHKYLQAGHDRSDGGLLVTLLEMAFAGNVGIDVTLQEAWNKKSELDRVGNQVPPMLISPIMLYNYFYSDTITVV